MTRHELGGGVREGRAVSPFYAAATGHVRSLIVAVQFLTRLPTPHVDLSDDAERRLTLGRATAYFPLVGALVGAMTGATTLLAARFWPVGLAVVIGLAVEAVVTGAFHEDAVADFCDAFGGGWTREDVLRILKDSRIGSFGALGLGLAVALRGGALASLETSQLLTAAAASACLGRWAVLPAMWALPPLSDRESLSRDVGQRIGLKRMALGTVMAIPGCVGFTLASPVRLAVAVAFILVLTLWLVRHVERRIGGMNGDSLGFLCHASQTVVLLSACASWRGPSGGLP